MRALVRNPTTWLAYGMLGFYAYLEAVLGPLMPFLRDKLQLNFTVAGLHFSAFALSTLLSGLVGERIVARLGRRYAFWLGGAGMAGGGLLVALGSRVAITLSGAALMGLLGTLLLVVIQAGLSDQYGEQRATALTEANIAASVCATLAPLLVGTMQRIGFGWQSALLIMPPIWLLAILLFGRRPIPNAVYATETDTQSARLPSLFWLYWLVIVLCVSAEWCIAFWGATYLEQAVGLSKVNASTTMSLFFAGMVLARVVGSRLTRLVRNSTLLIGALGISLIGFPLLWLAPITSLNLVGLFALGLGIANQYPVTLSIATATAPEQSDAANARVIMGIGLAIFAAPQVVGWLADRVAIRQAYGIVMVLLVLATGVAVYATLAAARQHALRSA